MRSLVQNAMQSSLRDAGLAWGVYELNRAPLIALDGAHVERRWLSGEGVFAAAINNVPAVEMAAVFDELRPC